MPRAPASSAQKVAGNTLVLDNGAYTIKAGFSSDNPSTDHCTIIPNCIAKSARDKRIYIGSQLDQCRDFGEMIFRRPVEKGYITNWEGQRAIWEHSFEGDNAVLKCDPHETNLLLTEAPNCPQTLRTNTDQIVFEEFEFAAYLRCLGPSLNAYNDIPTLFADPPPDVSPTPPVPVEALLLIESGYSHTTITPLIHGRPLHPSIRRLSIGGKLLTNHLKELISLRHYGLMDEPHLVNQIKEDVSFVSADFRVDLERAWKARPGGVDTSVVVDYVLPDYETEVRGKTRPHDPLLQARVKRLGAKGPREDVVPLGNERFAVPELLFNPGDIGLSEAGLPELVLQSLETVPEGLWGPLLANVVLVGGNVEIRGFVERLEKELRQITPSEYIVRVAKPADPIKYTWLGGARLASHHDTFKNTLVTKQEYDENGPTWLARKFAAGSPNTNAAS
ncbi:Actin/actin-like protein [Patellaria atrata CBS 101060]|uniref:Actin-like protein ARP6 n=1 Tax=Patellaria atrata CBS 101060 TaxID=1346257 RepID=A0A9P4SKL4_9PEZI|nr:Actin/actin-like protein [Patellaria atrata CBS 101060]